MGEGWRTIIVVTWLMSNVTMKGGHKRQHNHKSRHSSDELIQFFLSHYWNKILPNTDSHSPLCMRIVSVMGESIGGSYVPVRITIAVVGVKRRARRSMTSSSPTIRQKKHIKIILLGYFIFWPGYSICALPRRVKSYSSSRPLWIRLLPFLCTSSNVHPLPCSMVCWIIISHPLGNIATMDQLVLCTSSFVLCLAGLCLYLLYPTIRQANLNANSTQTGS